MLTLCQHKSHKAFPVSFPQSLQNKEKIMNRKPLKEGAIEYLSAGAIKNDKLGILSSLISP